MENVLNMAKLSVNQAFLKAQSRAQKGDLVAAKQVYQMILNAFPENKRALQGLAVLNAPKASAVSSGPPQETINQVVDLYNSGQLKETIERSQTITEQYPDTFILWNVLGAANLGLGKTKDAAAAFKRVTELNPNYAEGFCDLGVALQQQGLLEESIVSYSKALALKPDYPEAYYDMGNALKKQGKIERAIEAYNKALTFKPNYAVAYNNMGNALKEQGKYDEAVAAYKKTLVLKPDYANAYNNMGNVLKYQGNLDEAIAAFDKALAIKPNYPDAYNNMGNALKEQGKFEQAMTAYNKALVLKPNYPQAYCNMGNNLQEQGKFDEAMAAYSKALALKPDYPDAYNNIGTVRQEQGNFEGAITVYNKALALKPDHSDAWSNGAETLEKLNKLEQLDLWLKQASQVFETVPADIQFYQAKLFWRNKKFEEAHQLINTIDIELIADNRKKSYLELKAKCFESSNDFDQAYNCFSKMNLLAKESNHFAKSDPENYFQTAKNQLANLKSRPAITSPNNKSDELDTTPSFLIGFPRSGTTLLDTILRSHSCIEVAEEPGTVNTAKGFIKKNGHTDITNRLLPPHILADARKVYREVLGNYISEMNSNSVFIDRQPLNLIHAPLIQQLYPKAKYILALRHPMDAILSSWMQDFKLNPAMANMVNLDRIVDLYCIAMETFKICRADHDLNVHTIRYEDLVNDLSGETTALLKFLDLDWEPQMENYTDTAIKRGRIKTASYSQVVQPIYKDAQYRWLNYEKYLANYLPQVTPWINEFGYGDS